MGIDVGTLLEGRYRILKQLGAGAMGAVFLAENIRIGRRVAIKVLHSHVSHTEGAAVRFQQEARAATAAGSDHIIDILDFGDVPGGDLYMVMEYLEGESLKERMAKGKMRESDIVPIARQMLQGLAKAHAAGIVHRDLKPDNVFILKEYAGQRDWVKVLDFGICRLVGDDAEAEPSMTQTGMVLGTPHFMSPEHVKGSHHVTFKSDLYAVAAMIYRGLTGEVPFNGSNLTEIMYRIAYEPPPDHGVALTGVDARLVAIVLKGMARDPADRFGSADEFDRALGQLPLLPSADMGESMSATRRTNPPPSALPTPSNPPGPMIDTNPAVAKSLPLVLGKTAIPADQTTKDASPAAPAPRRNTALIFAGAAFGIGSIAAALAFTVMNKKSGTETPAKPTDTVAVVASGSSAAPSTETASRPADPPPSATSKPDPTTSSASPPTTTTTPAPSTNPTGPLVASPTPQPSTVKPPTTPPTTHPTSIATDNPYQ